MVRCPRRAPDRGFGYSIRGYSVFPVLAGRGIDVDWHGAVQIGCVQCHAQCQILHPFLGGAGIIGFPLVAYSAAQLIGHNWDPSYSLLQHGDV